VVKEGAKVAVEEPGGKVVETVVEKVVEGNVWVERNVVIQAGRQRRSGR
jgi:hypothetical protein